MKKDKPIKVIIKGGKLEIPKKALELLASFPDRGEDTSDKKEQPKITARIIRPKVSDPNKIKRQWQFFAKIILDRIKEKEK